MDRTWFPAAKCCASTRWRARGRIAGLAPAAEAAAVWQADEVIDLGNHVLIPSLITVMGTRP